MLGRVMGLIITISSALIPLGIILSGILIDLIPSHLLYFLSGTLLLLISTLLHRSPALKSY
jgi:uncharacterized membrane protein